MAQYKIVSDSILERLEAIVSSGKDDNIIEFIAALELYIHCDDRRIDRLNQNPYFTDKKKDDLFRFHEFPTFKDVEELLKVAELHIAYGNKYNFPEV